MRARPPLARRFRAGLAFGAEPAEIAVGADGAALIRADPWLIAEPAGRP